MLPLLNVKRRSANPGPRLPKAGRADGLRPTDRFILGARCNERKRTWAGSKARSRR